MREFVGSIRTGGKGAGKLRQPITELGTVQAWDGKDGQAVEEEEFSLDDIMGAS